MTAKIIKESVKTIYSIESIDVHSLKKNDILLLDVDDTLITPSDACFRYDKGNNPFINMCDDLKSEYKKGNIDKERFEKILGVWRLSRDIMLVEPQWVDIFKKVHDKGVHIIGLTNIHIGTFGSINSMEKWRYEELKNHNLTFSNITGSEKVQTIVEGKVSYYKGILFNQGLSKGKVLQQLIPYLPSAPSKLIFLDDRKDNAISIKETCAMIGLDCDSYVYRSIETINQPVDYAFAQKQKETLFNDFVWLKDE